MIGKKINQLATELSPATDDLTIIGDPVTGVSKKITLLQIANLFATTGTVSSVAVTESGDALTITGSPITSAGTINIGFAGNSTQYINGAGNLVTFPSIISQAANLVTEVYNSTGATLTKGTIVYINGGQGNLPTVTKALATGDSTSAQTFGVVQANITNNNNGYVVVAGKLSDLDTQAYTAGTQLYLSSTTAGTWTSTKQYAPNHLVYVGVVVRSHPTQGIVEVKIQNGYELDELHDVAAQTPSNNDGLFFESSTSLWKNKSIATILGGTPVTGTGTTNTLPKFTGASTIGNSNITDTGSLITLGSDTYVNGAMGFGTSTLGSYIIRIVSPLTGGTTTYGISNAPVIQSSVTSAASIYRTAPQTQAASFTLSNLNHFFAEQSVIGAGSTVSTQIGFYADNSLIGATNNYGFYGGIPSGTNRWNLYMAGTANNYMGGALGIGATSLTARGLSVSKNITNGTVSYGIVSDGTIQSDVTSSGSYYLTSANTAPASFTLSNIYHYLASQSTFGVGSTITSQAAFQVQANLIGATNNYGFRGLIPSGTNRWNLYMDGTADNYLAGNTGIGNSQTYVSSGPILTTTLTNGGSGYVDGTYVDVATTTASSASTGALFTVVVSGGVAISATLTWAGGLYRAGDVLNISNTLLGGTGSGLIITVNTVDSSQLTIVNANGADISLLRNDTGLASGENLGTIKWLSNDTSTKANGLQAEIGAFGASTNGGAYLSFSTRSVSAGTSLVEAMRIDSRGGVGIGATTLTGYGLRVSKNITGATNAFGISSDAQIQSDVTGSATYYRSTSSTAAAAFTLSALIQFRAAQGTFGAGSTVTNQYGYFADQTLIGATNNYGFYGEIPAAANRWNLFMNGTANNYLAGNLLIGSTTDAGFKLDVNGTARVQGNTQIKTNITGTATSTLRIDNGGTLGNEVSLEFFSSTTSSTGSNRSGRIKSYFTGASFTTSFLTFQSVTTGDSLIDTLSLNNGNVLIGTTTPAGFRLDVNGTARVQGALTVTGSTTAASAIARGANFTSTLVAAANYDTLVGLDISPTFTNGSFIGVNNYALRLNAASGSFVWNLYASGTANNYMEGSLGIGTISPSEKLEVNGNIKTASPTGGTAQAWKLGEDTNTLYTATRTIRVEIAGSVYYLLAVKSSDL